MMTVLFTATALLGCVNCMGYVVLTLDNFKRILYSDQVLHVSFR
jgi:hypothetical protein